MKLPNTIARTLKALGPITPLVLGLALAGCDKEVEATGPVEEELPNVKVELPASPDFDEARASEKWDGEDGAWSIYGLRKDIDDRLQEGADQKEIIIRGWVQEKYNPPVCPEDELCPPGKQPHFWITDHKDEKGKKRAMMVVNYSFPIPEWDTDTQKMWEEQPLVDIEVGKQYTFKGYFVRFSGSGFAHDNGLIEFRYYKAPDPENPTAPQTWVAPPNSDWHPQTVEAQAEQNRIMQEKMQEDAAKLQEKRGG